MAQWWAHSMGRLRCRLSVVCLSSVIIFKHLLSINRWTNRSLNSCGAFLGSGEQKFLSGVKVTSPKWPQCPYMIKSLQKMFYSVSSGTIGLKLGMWHWGLNLVIFSSNYNPWLTFDAKVKFGQFCFCIGESENAMTAMTQIFFSGTMGRLPWNLICSIGALGHLYLFEWWPCVDLDLFYAEVKFGHLCFYMGKIENC